MKKNVLIDYRILDTKKYLGNSFPPLLYQYLKKINKYNVYDLSNKKLPKIDLLFIINGGSHWNYIDLKVNNFDYRQLIKWIYPKIERYVIWIGFFFGLYRLQFYQRHLFRNRSYEKHIEKIIKDNPKIKIIHRLDGSYQTICKVYGYDKTVKFLNDKAHLTIHQSNYSKKLWENKNETIFGKSIKLKPKKSIIINNGVDTNIFKPKKITKQKKSTWKILHVSASSNPKKGLYKLLEIAYSLKENNKFKFFLIGKQINDPVCGGDIKYFKNVKYLGDEKDRLKIAKIYRKCDILFFPSLEDCSPNVILEAMSSGLPILTLDSGGIKELIHKENLKAGIFLDKKNPILSLDFIIRNYSSFYKNTQIIIKKYHNYKNSIQKYIDEIEKILRDE